MRSTMLISGLLASVLFAPAALAQQSKDSFNPPAAAPANSNSAVIAPTAQSGQWRASKLVGLDVYNEQNEKLGDINEILLDQTGKVTGVVIGVGGFLGMGERDIMVTLDKLKFMKEPVRTSSNTSTTAPGANTTGAAERTTTTTTSVTTTTNNKWSPEHAVLSGATTKDQLKSIPEFKYN
jgi:sporulation protein YlmC with PRC-barrel domain